MFDISAVPIVVFKNFVKKSQHDMSERFEISLYIKINLYIYIYIQVYTQPIYSSNAYLYV